MAGEVLLVNPRRRRRRKAKATRKRRRRSVARRVVRVRSRRRRSNPIRMRRRSRRRRNPIGLSTRGITNQVMQAGGGAVGALGLDLALGYLPIPANLKAGMVGYLTKGALAIALGMVASKVVKSSTAAQMANGALTVVLHDALKNSVAQFAPNIRLGEYVTYDGDLGYYGSGWNPGGDMGGYLPDLSTPSYDMTPLNAYANDSGDF